MIRQVDGSILEGGGQILRISIALSGLCKFPVQINKIRANRKKDGLAPQHLTGLELARDLCGGKLENGFLRSTCITFTPHNIKSGEYMADTKTGGSVALILQVILPYLLYGNNKSHLTLKGGTNADLAPPIDYIINVLRPVLQKFGADFECEIIRRGFFQGNGSISVSANPVKKLLPVDLVDFGEVEVITGEAYVSGVLPFKMAEEMAQTAEKVLRGKISQKLYVKPKKFTNSEAFGNGSGINLYAKTTTGCHLGCSVLGKKGVSTQEVGTEAAKALLHNLNMKVCVDSNMQDQLIIYMAIAGGKSRVKVGPITLHTQTAIHIAELLTNAKFNIIKLDQETNIIECEGIGLENEAINRRRPLKVDLYKELVIFINDISRQ